MLDHVLARNPLQRGEVLLVGTSTRSFPEGKEAGAWLPELAVPYCQFVKRGWDVTIASPEGGQIPLESVSNPTSPEDAECVEKFLADKTAAQSMAGSVPIGKVDSIGSYCVVFLAGGHGAAMDFPSCKPLQALVKEAIQKGVIVAAVSHGSSVFASEELGKMVAGKRLAVWADAQEQAAGRDSEVPFLLESRLRELGVNANTPDMMLADKVAVDGRIITGADSAATSKVVSEVLKLLDQAHPASPVPSAHHPGSMLAGEVPEVLGVAPIVSPNATPTTTPRTADGPTSVNATPRVGPGPTDVSPDMDMDEEDEVDEEVVEPYMVNLGPGAMPNPGTHAGNDTPAGA